MPSIWCSRKSLGITWIWLMQRCESALALIQSRRLRIPAFESGSPHATAELPRSLRSGKHVAAGHDVMTVIVVSLSTNISSA
jgi:hypothetical protein